jgi:hypothetical protein
MEGGALTNHRSRAGDADENEPTQATLTPTRPYYGHIGSTVDDVLGVDAAVGDLLSRDNEDLAELAASIRLPANVRPRRLRRDPDGRPAG